MTAPAPLAVAIEGARKSLAEYETLCPMGVRTGSLLYGVLRSLLLALDADDRLTKAEAALMRIKQGDLCVDGLRPGMYGHGMEIARRYFAEKERSMGNDMYNDEQLADAKARAQTSDFLPDYEFGNVLGRIPVSEHSREACRILRAHDAALRLALETATRERDEARRIANEWYESTLNFYPPNWAFDPMSPGRMVANVAEWRDARIATAERERDAAVARLNATEALLLDVWDSQHREGWEATETERSVIDRLGDWRWNNGFDPHNPPLRADPRKKGAPE